MGILRVDHVTPLYPQKLALTSPTGGVRSVDIVRSRTKATELVSFMRAKGSLERDIMLRKVAAHKRQGKASMRWLDSIKEATGLRLEVLEETGQEKIACAG